ncbi:hypothetical protein [Arcticibacter tournemirensis]|uniref:Uncharacterized protein n=1 Tax=Arcticibacter tournemirensis TaxID=699437 RepID=A0A4Q0M322_9SPHI|nr:hypothetical protein [Arcticibacter tournemirensis]RXF67311.1 hypothetical protein EKH83_20315 [Arcticibacter tournemirensis]
MISILRLSAVMLTAPYSQKFVRTSLGLPAALWQPGGRLTAGAVRGATPAGAGLFESLSIKSR